MQLPKRCNRCGQKEYIFTTSIFNTEWICQDCQELEKEHPEYQKAKDAELTAVKQGNYNFQGIGLPKNLRR